MMRNTELLVDVPVPSWPAMGVGNLTRLLVELEKHKVPTTAAIAVKDKPGSWGGQFSVTWSETI